MDQILVWGFYKTQLLRSHLKHHDLKLSPLFLSQVLTIVSNMCVVFYRFKKHFPNPYLILGLGFEAHPIIWNIYSLENPQYSHHLPSEAL